MTRSRSRAARWIDGCDSFSSRAARLKLRLNCIAASARNCATVSSRAKRATPSPGRRASAPSASRAPFSISAKARATRSWKSSPISVGRMPSRADDEQFGAEPRLELGQRLGDRRLRKVDALGGARRAADVRPRRRRRASDAGWGCRSTCGGGEPFGHSYNKNLWQGTNSNWPGKAGRRMIARPKRRQAAAAPRGGRRR